MSVDEGFAAADRCGTTLGPYAIEELLGRGGMGQVYRATDTRKDRVVALKLLNPDLADNEIFRGRFERESRVAAKLNDPHVVPIHDWGEIDGLLYIDMRLVKGQDLRSILGADGPLSPTRTVHVLAQVAEALDAAHDDGLVHRDVKPDNILVDRHDFTYLADFGLAQADTDTRLTTAGAAIGSFAYMAPERFGPNEVGAAGDVYALACVLYETLSGIQPFASATTIEQLITAHLTQPAPTLGSPIDPVIACGMAKEPAERYATAGALIAAARAAYEGATGHHRMSPPTVLPPTILPPPRPGESSGGIPGAGHAAPPTRGPGHRPAGTPRPHRPVATPPLSVPLPPPGDSARLPAQGAPFVPTGHYTYGAPQPLSPPVAPLNPSANHPPTQSRGMSAIPIALVVIALLLATGIGIGTWKLLSGSRTGGADAQAPGTSTHAVTPVPNATAPQTAEPSAGATQSQPGLPTSVTTPPAPTTVGRGAFDLGLSTPISQPACDGTGIVVVGNAVNEATWASEVQGYLTQFPGSSYLRTDQSCSSLRHRDDNGNVIYAVYQVAGRTQADVCRLRNQLGGDSYGKWLDNTTDPTTNIPASQC